MSSDEDSDYYGSKTSDRDRTLYLRRTNFGQAGRNILTGGGAGIHDIRGDGDSDDDDNFSLPKYGRQGPPRDAAGGSRDNSDHEERPALHPSDSTSDALTRQEREKEEKETDVASSDHAGGQKWNEVDESEGKTKEEEKDRARKSKIMPPPRVPPPRGVRPSAAVAAARKQLSSMAPPAGRPKGSAAAQYRARLMKQRLGKNHESKVAYDPTPKEPSGGASSKYSEDVSVPGYTTFLPLFAFITIALTFFKKSVTSRVSFAI